jgi:hypothetical protein
MEPLNMHRFTSWSLAGSFVFALSAIGMAASSGPAVAQNKANELISSADQLLPDQSKEKDWTRTEEYRTFKQMVLGTVPVGGDPAAAKLLDDAAQWFAYRFTWDSYQKRTGKGMKELRAEIFESFPRPPKPEQQAFVEEFGKKLTARLAEVVKNRKKIARLNAAMVLARLAATGQEQAADVLAKVVADPKENDAVKLYALRGLRDIFALGQGENPVYFKNRELEGRCIATLIAYVAQPRDLKEAAPEEVNAVRFVRNAAIEALGQTRYPAVSELVDPQKKKTAIERPTAFVLLRVVRKDGIVPEPSLTEQVTAMESISRLQSKLLPEYNVDYVTHQLGAFLVQFIELSNNRSSLPKPEKWKVLGAKVVKALADLQADVAAPPAHADAKYVASFVSQAQPLVRAIALDQGDRPNAALLSTWLEQQPPKANTAYKNVNEAVIKVVEK